MSKIATARRVIVNIRECAEFEWCKVEVPLVFLGTEGFSTCREGRYWLSMFAYLCEHFSGYGTIFFEMFKNMKRHLFQYGKDMAIPVSLDSHQSIEPRHLLIPVSA